MRKLSFLAVGSACLFVSACGSSGSGGSGASKDPDAARVRFADCMRKAGVQVSTPAGGGLNVSVPKSAGINPQRMEKLQKDCTKSSGMPEPQAPSPAMQAKAQDAALKFAACMRAHGVNMPDPKFDGGRIAIMIPRNINPNTPRVQAAQKTCQKLMPGPGASDGGGSNVGGPGSKSGGTLSGP